MNTGETQTTAAKPSVLAQIAGVIAAGVGWAVGQYTGLALIIPMGLALLCGWMFHKFGPERSRPMAPAAALQCGQGLWMTIGMVALSEFGPNVVEVGLLLGGAVWLVLRPSIVPVVLLGAYQVFGLVANALAFREAAFGTPAHKALLVHLLLRTLVLIALAAGLVTIRRADKSAGELLDDDEVEPLAPGADGTPAA